MIPITVRDSANRLRRHASFAAAMEMAADERAVSAMQEPPVLGTYFNSAE